MKLLYLIFMVSAICVVGVVGPPVNQKKSEEKEHENSLFDKIDYAAYLTQVVQVLEEDESFRKKLANASEHQIKSGDIARELDFVDHRVRSKLDELKRTEMERLRHSIRQQHELSQGLDRRQIKIPTHIDHRNEQTFEIEDLKKLIKQATSDIEEADKERRKEFKNYEMEKEMERQEKLKRMDEEHRKKAEEEYQEQVQKHKNHPKLHHPGTKEQFKEVWEKEDQLPGNEFNLKTFFRMHDIDSDGYWDMNEVKAIFRNELNKMYNENMTEDDMQERMEEMERMREHVFGESDTDRDGVISFKEFQAYSQRQEYEEDPGWQGIDEQPQYTKEEYELYERMRRDDLANLAAQGINPWGGPNYIPDGMYPPPHLQGQMPPNYHPNQGYPQMPNQQYPQQQMPQQHYQQQQYQQAPQQPNYQQVQQQQQQQQYQQVPQQQQYQQVPQHQQFQQQVPQQQQQIPQQQVPPQVPPHQPVPVQNQQLPPTQQEVKTPIQQQNNQVPVEQEKQETAKP